MTLRRRREEVAKEVKQTCCYHFLPRNSIFSPELSYDALNIFSAVFGGELCPSTVLPLLSGWCIMPGWESERVLQMVLSAINYCCKNTLSCISCSHSHCSNPVISEASKEMCVGLLYSCFYLGLAETLEIGT